jgi:hypothetical protein
MLFSIWRNGAPLVPSLSSSSSSIGGASSRRGVDAESPGERHLNFRLLKIEEESRQSQRYSRIAGGKFKLEGNSEEIQLNSIEDSRIWWFLESS